MNISTTPHSNDAYGFGRLPVSRKASNGTDALANITRPLNPAAPGSESAPKSQAPDNAGSRSEEASSTSPAKDGQPLSNTSAANGQTLTQAELQLVQELKQIDTEVRQHEMAHIAAGGRFITSGATFSYKRGPDGTNYAVAGEVGIDTSPVPGDPQATLQKMRQVKSAALAPASPSSQDLKVASNATSAASKALSDLMILQAKKQADANETRAFGSLQKAADSYERVNRLPEGDTASFQIAV